MTVLDRFRLTGTRLVITGGSRGLGREMALAIAEAGADGVMLGRDADSLARTAADWAPLGITVNAILPGFFMTEPNQRWARENPAMIDSIRACVPIGEPGQPEDLGPLAVSLASDAARDTTGSAILIDGGDTIR